MGVKCVICKDFKDEVHFLYEQNGKEVLGKSCKECNKNKSDVKKNVLKLKYKHIWERKDGTMITDPWEIVDDHKIHTCKTCYLDKSVREFVICGSKYNPKLSINCKDCLDIKRDGVGRRKRGEYKQEWYWNNIKCTRRNDGSIWYES